MALRREVRLRKEFLYKKQLDAQQNARNDKKRLLQSAIDEGCIYAFPTPLISPDKAIPTEIRHDARALQHEMEYDIVKSDEKQIIDDEYATVGMQDPKVCVTTSRDPSSRLKQFSKEIKLCIPNAQSINRGNYRIDELIEACRKANFSDVVVLNETRGQPDGLIVCHLPFGPTAYFTLSNAVLRHDIPECTPASQAYPHLILDNFTSSLGARVSRILQALYPVPKPDTQRVITFANRNDFISFRHHMYSKEKNNITLKEAGPRFELQCYEIRLGTMDQDHAETEWVLRPYMNTSRKKQAL